MWNDVKERWKERSWIRRYLCLVLVAVLVTTQCTQSMGVNLVIAQTSCPSHKQHDEDCGYKETRTAQPCSHNCEDGTCSYQEAVPEQPCDHSCDENCVKDENGSCVHNCEDEACSYQKAVPEQPCNHSCDESCSYVEIVIEQPCSHTCSECESEVIEETPEGEGDEVIGETPEGEGDEVIDGTTEVEGDEVIDETPGSEDDDILQDTENDESVENTQECLQHVEHDDTCGYIEGDESAVCTHSCLECNPASGLSLTEAVFDKSEESENYKDIGVTFSKGADELERVEAKIETEDEAETGRKEIEYEYVTSEAGETVTLKKETLAQLEEGSYTVYFVMKSGAELPFALTVTTSQQEDVTYALEGARATDVPINESTFPDENFRNYVSRDTIDINQDKILSVDELEAVDEIAISGTSYAETERHQYTNLKGIEHFTKLKYLYCFYGNLEGELDLSYNTELRVVYAYYNYLTSVNVSGCTKLYSFAVQANRLTSVDVSNCTVLDTLDCDYNQITSLQLPGPDENGQMNLRVLYCYRNQLTSLEVSEYTKLETFWCWGNQLTSLNVSENTALKSLDCRYNQLTSLDLSQNTNLTKVQADGQTIGVLPLYYNATSKKYVNTKKNSTEGDREFNENTGVYSDDTMLTELEGFGVENKLVTAELDRTGSGTGYFSSILVDGSDGDGYDGWTLEGSFVYILPGYIDVNEVDALTSANDLISRFGITSGTVNCPNYAAIKAGTTGQYDVTITSGNTTYDTVIEVGVEINDVNFPDDNFETHVSEYDTGAKEKFLTYAELVAVKTMSLSGEANTEDTEMVPHPYKSLKGIEYFTKLQYLSCSYGNLEELDLSKNTALQTVWCVKNQLTSLQLPGPDESGQMQLRRLFCRSNQLKSLDVSKYTALEELWCYGNQLSSLDLSKNTNLTDVLAGSQRIGVLPLYYNATSNKYVNTKKNSTEGDREFNENTGIYSDKTMSTGLEGFGVENKLMTADLDRTGVGTGYFSSILVDRSAEEKENWTLEGSFVYILPGYIDVKEVDALTSADDLISRFGITSGTVDCPNYAAIKAGTPGQYDVTITSGDMTYDTVIEVGVEINGTNFPDDNFEAHVPKYDTGAKTNFLTLAELEAVDAIDISGKGTAETERHPYKSLKGIEYFTKLETLHCYYGQLEGELDLSYNTELLKVVVHNNYLSSVNVSGCTELTHMEVQQNSLTSLNVSKNTKLQTLWCTYNQLTSLDVSENTELESLRCYNNQLTNLDLSTHTKLTDVQAYDQKPGALTMTYEGTQWTDSSGRKYVPTYTKFYSDADMATDPLPFSVNGDGTVTATTVLPLTDPIYFKSEVYDGNKNPHILSGTVSYTSSGTLTAETYYIDIGAVGTLPEDKNGLVQYFDMNVGEDVAYTVVCEDYEAARAGTVGSYSVTINYGTLSVAAKLEVGVEINGTNFPDDNFEAYVSKCDTGAKANFLTLAELEAVDTIDISGEDTTEEGRHPYKSLKGIEYFTKLQYLYCLRGNLEGELDLSYNTELIEVRASDNYLSSVNVSGCTKVYRLTVQGNSLTSLDVSTCKALVHLDCAGNEVTSLQLPSTDENGQTKLVRLYCYKNQLESLDVSKYTKLQTLHCYDNQLTSLDEDGVLKDLRDLKCSNNPLGSLNLSNYEQLLTLYCSNNQLTELNLEKNIELTDLVCEANDLEELNVSMLEDLTSLNCDGNRLTSLDISGLTNLQSIDANEQRIENLPMVYNAEAEWNWNYDASREAEVVTVEKRTFTTGSTQFYDKYAGEQLDSYALDNSGALMAKQVLTHESIYFETTLADGTETLNGTITLDPSYSVNISANNRFYTAQEMIDAGLSDAGDLKNLPDLLSITPNTPEFIEATTTSMATDYADKFTELQSGTAGIYGYQAVLLNLTMNGQIEIVSEGSVVSDDHSAYLYAKNFYIGVTAAKNLEGATAISKAATTYKNALGTIIDGTENSEPFSVSVTELEIIQSGEAGKRYPLTIIHSESGLENTVQVALVDDEPTDVIILPATMELENQGGSTIATAEEYIELVTGQEQTEGTEGTGSTEVKVYTEASFRLTSVTNKENTLLLKVYDENDVLHDGESPLAVLNTEIKKKKFRLKSGDTTNLMPATYTGTMEFKIEYGEGE